MQIKFRDSIGTSVVEVSANGVSFLDGFAYFDDVDEQEYKVPMENVEEIRQGSREEVPCYSDQTVSAMVFKGTSGNVTVWYPEIPADEPLMAALLEKYGNDGGSMHGTREDAVEDLRENL